MRVAIALLIAAGCGRIGFDEQDPIGDAIVACYPLDEADPSAGTFDSSANRLHGSCTPPACPLGTTSSGGSAYLFDGIDDHVRVAYDPRLVTLGGLTVTMWMRADRFQKLTNQTMFSKPIGSGFGNSWEMTMIDGDSDGAIELRLVLDAGGALVVIDRDPPFAEGEWAHVAGSWEGSRGALFVDGVEIGAAPKASIPFDTQDMFIGADFNNGAPDSFFVGALRDVCLYDRALAPFELRELAQRL